MVNEDCRSAVRKSLGDLMSLATDGISAASYIWDHKEEPVDNVAKEIRTKSVLFNQKGGKSDSIEQSCGLSLNDLKRSISNLYGATAGASIVIATRDAKKIDETGHRAIDRVLEYMDDLRPILAKAVSKEQGESSDEEE